MVPTGDEDIPYQREARGRLEEGLPGSATVMLPDVEPLVRGNKSLEPLVWGNVLISGAPRNQKRSFPAMFTDPLWMRLVTNGVLEELGADAVLSRNLPRQGMLRPGERVAPGWAGRRVVVSRATRLPN